MTDAETRKLFSDMGKQIASLEKLVSSLLVVAKDTDVRTRRMEESQPKVKK